MWERRTFTVSCSFFFFNGRAGGWGVCVPGELNWKLMMDHQVESKVHVLIHANTLNAAISGIVEVYCSWLYTNFIIKADYIFILFCNVFIGTTACMRVYFYDRAKFNSCSEQSNMMMLHTCTIRFHNKIHFSTLIWRWLALAKSSGSIISRLSYSKMLLTGR